MVLCGYTQYYIAEWNLRKKDGVKVDEVRKEIMARDENPDAWVLQIGLQKELPEGLKIPSPFKGLRVYVEWIGEISALKKTNIKQFN